MEDYERFFNENEQNPKIEDMYQAFKARMIAENEKKPKKGKFDAAKMVFPMDLNVISWLEWVEFRKSRKKITELAAKKQFETLLKYDQTVQAQMINYSIANDYQGIFPPNSPPKAEQKSIMDRLKDRSWAAHMVDLTEETLLIK